MNSLPILYSFRRCPYAMRARLALLLAGIKCYIREVDLKNKPQEMLAISPKATVPVLQLETGKVLEESLDIVNYALASKPEFSLTEQEASLVEELIERNNKEFIPLIVKYKYFNRYPEHPQSFYRQKIEDGFLSEIEDILRNNNYLIANRLTTADIAIMPFVRQFAIVDEEWFFSANYPGTIRWLNSFLNAQIFHAAMAKYEPWQPNDAPVVLS